MPLQLEEYLRTELPARKAEIVQIGETAGVVLRNFHLAFDHSKKAWPYRIDRDTTPSAAESDKYSFSTNAMVLFALKALLGDYEDSIRAIAGSGPRLNWSSGQIGLLTPMLARPDKDLIVERPGAMVDPADRDQAWKTTCDLIQPIVKKTSEELVTQVDRKLASSGCLTESSTFGKNDPFTLCWLMESAVPPPQNWMNQLENVPTRH